MNCKYERNKHNTIWTTACASSQDDSGLTSQTASRLFHDNTTVESLAVNASEPHPCLRVFSTSSSSEVPVLE